MDGMCSGKSYNADLMLFLLMKIWALQLDCWLLISILSFFFVMLDWRFAILAVLICLLVSMHALFRTESQACCRFWAWLVGVRCTGISVANSYCLAKSYAFRWGLAFMFIYLFFMSDYLEQKIRIIGLAGDNLSYRANIPDILYLAFPGKGYSTWWF